MSNNRIKVISIVGPTASGKTALSISVAKAFNGEVVSCDSMQIYKGMDIATAKPTLKEQDGIPHHLIDVADPSDVYSVARYVEDATFVIKDITARGKLPVIAGGTGLYVDSLLGGISFCDGNVDLNLRHELQLKLEEIGIDGMLNLLSEFDPESADRMRIERNPKRIVRAFEVYYTTGTTMTEQNIHSRDETSVFEPIKIGINYRDRKRLYDRINLRVDMMLDAGLLKEAQKYLSSPKGETSKQAIGYKELKPYFAGEKSLEECIETLKRSTRRYAKRQLTWFNRDPQIKWYFADDYNDIQELHTDIISYLKAKGFDVYENA